MFLVLKIIALPKRQRGYFLNLYDALITLKTLLHFAVIPLYGGVAGALFAPDGVVFFAVVIVSVNNKDKKDNNKKATATTKKISPSGKPARCAHRLAPFADTRSLFVAQLTLRRG